MRRGCLALMSLAVLAAACGDDKQGDPAASDPSVFDSGKTAYGFFPVPPEATIESVFQLFDDVSDHGEFVVAHSTEHRLAGLRQRIRRRVADPH
ncbi:MAG: hypothetical protein HY826_08630 [Actinobacteria bacterium]|nr:hypothetical protein [Actinomycetota bacterium]